MADFKRSLAVVIGITGYQHGIKTTDGKHDAERLADTTIEHGHDHVILVTDETLQRVSQKSKNCSFKISINPR
jgi:hypothetical protein